MACRREIQNGTLRVFERIDAVNASLSSGLSDISGELRAVNASLSAQLRNGMRDISGQIKDLKDITVENFELVLKTVEEQVSRCLAHSGAASSWVESLGRDMACAHTHMPYESGQMESMPGGI